jgi:ABC-type lipoprotein export system ATPase subunit
MHELEQRRTELLLQNFQSSFAAHLRTGRQAADALAAATTQSTDASAYLALLLGQHHAQMNPLEEFRRQQGAMFLQQQQMVPYAQQQQMITFAQQLAAAALQQQDWADEAKERAQRQERK